MPFQKGNKFGGAKKGHRCFNGQELSDSKWMMKGAERARVRTADVSSYLADGWTLGRPTPSVETKKKQSASQKKCDNPAHWKTGHRSWNFGDKMPESAGVAMSVARLTKYGVTEQQIIAARAENKSWCSHHLQFEPNSAFRMNKNGRRATRCNECHNKHTPEYKKQFMNQKGVCGICEEIEPRLDALSVDHWHDCRDPRHTRKHEPRIGCECSRGLLCSKCNPRLGYVESVLLSLQLPITLGTDCWEYKALIYLNKYKK